MRLKCMNALTGRTVDDKDDGQFFLQFDNQSPYLSSLDRAGDPCLPIPWTWLHCSIELPPRVTQVNLTGKGFVNNLPLHLDALNRLSVLDLLNNSFSGGVPRSLGNISTLRVLNLERNNLSGQLSQLAPQSFKNLEFLSLSGNQLTGSLQSLISALDDSLTYLNLSSNYFNGSIPALGNLTSLKTLDLSNNELELLNLACPNSKICRYCEYGRPVRLWPTKSSSTSSSTPFNEIGIRTEGNFDDGHYASQLYIQ